MNVAKQTELLWWNFIMASRREVRWGGTKMYVRIAITCLAITFAGPASADALFDAYETCKKKAFRQASIGKKSGWDREMVNSFFFQETRECMESTGYRFICLRANGPIPNSELMASCYDRR